MSGYKDFLTDPEGEYEHFDAAVAAAFEWVKANNVRIINFETVFVPELSVQQDTQVAAYSAAVPRQYVRVWYTQG